MAHSRSRDYADPGPEQRRQQPFVAFKKIEKTTEQKVVVEKTNGQTERKVRRKNLLKNL